MYLSTFTYCSMQKSCTGLCALHFSLRCRNIFLHTDFKVEERNDNGECEEYDLKNDQKSKTVGLPNTPKHLYGDVIVGKEFIWLQMFKIKTFFRFVIEDA